MNVTSVSCYNIIKLPTRVKSAVSKMISKAGSGSYTVWSNIDMPTNPLLSMVAHECGHAVEWSNNIISASNYTAAANADTCLVTSQVANIDSDVIL
jgi:hypothetical protein